LILGITGTIGCGKSTVFSLFRAAGWLTFDADGFCRSLYAGGNPAFAAGIKDLFGDGVFNADGTIDRKKVADAVFNNSVTMTALTDLIYPLLDAGMEEAMERCRKSGANGAFEVPLLYEAGYQERFDRVLAVWCDPALRFRRLRELRGLDEADIRRREARQWPDARKLELADYAIVNNGSREMLEKQFNLLLEEVQRCE